MPGTALFENNKVILLAPNCDGTDVGEAWRAFKWCEAISNKISVVVLSFQRSGRRSVEEQLPNAEVVAWSEPHYYGARCRAMAIVSIGAAAGYLAMMIGKFLGATELFIDSIANSGRLSLLGELATYHADFMLTQWSDMCRIEGVSYSGSVVGEL